MNKITVGRGGVMVVRGSGGGGARGRGDFTGKMVFNGMRGVKQGSGQNHSWQRRSGGGDGERRRRKRRFDWKNNF